VRAWRSSADAWRDRFHREEQRTAFWRSIAVGQAIGVVLGLLAWRVL
jgi:anti-sigma-K factor RskA